MKQFKIILLVLVTSLSLSSFGAEFGAEADQRRQQDIRNLIRFLGKDLQPHLPHAKGLLANCLGVRNEHLPGHDQKNPENTRISVQTFSGAEVTHLDNVEEDETVVDSKRRILQNIKAMLLKFEEEGKIFLGIDLLINRVKLKDIDLLCEKLDETRTLEIAFHFKPLFNGKLAFKSLSGTHIFSDISEIVSIQELKERLKVELRFPSDAELRIFAFGKPIIERRVWDQIGIEKDSVIIVADMTQRN